MLIIRISFQRFVNYCYSIYLELLLKSNRIAAASDKVYQLLAHGRWFSLASSTTKTDRHNIAEILLKVALCNTNQIKSNPIEEPSFNIYNCIADTAELNPGSTKEGELSVFHLNTRSMRHKLDYIESICNEADIIYLTETHLYQNITNDDIFLEGYCKDPFRKDRNNSRGGGGGV